MALATGWAYYYRIRPINDQMDTLRLYREYKYYWDKHRIPGETKINEVLWEDTWWKLNSPYKGKRKLPPLRQSSRFARNKERSSMAIALPQHIPRSTTVNHRATGGAATLSSSAMRPSTYNVPAHAAGRSVAQKAKTPSKRRVVLPQIASSSSKSLLSSSFVSPSSSKSSVIVQQKLPATKD